MLASSLNLIEKIERWIPEWLGDWTKKNLIEEVSRLERIKEAAEKLPKDVDGIDGLTLSAIYRFLYELRDALDAANA